VTDDFLRYWGFLAWRKCERARLALHWHFDRSKLEPWSRGLAATFARAKLRTIAAIMAPAPVLASVRHGDQSLRRCWSSRRWPSPRRRSEPWPAIAPSPLLSNECARMAAAFTPLANVSGAPAMSLPMGRTSTGLPHWSAVRCRAWPRSHAARLGPRARAAQPWEPIAPRERWRAPAASASS